MSGDEEGSAISSVNSVKSHNHEFADGKLLRELMEENKHLKVENLRLLQDLIDVQKTYQDLLKHCIVEKKYQVHLMASKLENGKTRVDSVLI